MAISLAVYIAAVILVVLIAVCVISWRRERKELANYEKLTHIVIFHCRKCNAVYAAYPKNGKAPCPTCNHINSSLKF